MPNWNRNETGMKLKRRRFETKPEHNCQKARPSRPRNGFPRPNQKRTMFYLNKMRKPIVPTSTLRAELTFARTQIYWFLIFSFGAANQGTYSRWDMWMLNMSNFGSRSILDAP